jgi:chromate transporter
MQRDLVDDKKWYSQETFKDGMALSQLAPGPLATQMAIYLGWFHSGVLGATLVGFFFVTPSFLMVLVLAELYRQFGSLAIIQRLFHGIGPAVIAIICIGVYKLARRNLTKSLEHWTIAIVNALVVVITETEVIWVFLLSGLAFMVLKMSPRNRLMSIIPTFRLIGLNGQDGSDQLTSLFTFFLKAGTIVFGSGLAIVPFLHNGVVSEYHWLSEGQFLDAVAVAMITPGPVVITVAFIGFLVAGFAGACIAAFGTFMPCFLFTVIPAPHFSKIAQKIHLKNFVSGITSAAIGAILGSAIILGRGSLVDIPGIAIFAYTLLGLIFVKKVPEPLWIVLAGVVGCLI